MKALLKGGSKNGEIINLGRGKAVEIEFHMIIRENLNGRSRIGTWEHYRKIKKRENGIYIFQLYDDSERKEL